MIDLEKIFLNPQNAKTDIIELLEKILELKINRVKFVGKEYFKNIGEYDFSLIKLNLLCEKDKNIQVYLKNIKGGKIKESIFCFWSLIYEDFLKKNEEEYDRKKVIIKQKEYNESDSKIVLTFDQSLDYCAEISLVKLFNYASKYSKGKRWLNNLQIKKEDILFIGRVLDS